MSYAKHLAILDHGYIAYVEHWGADERIIEAARMSTAKGFQGWGPKHEAECMRPDLRFGECTCNGPVAGDEKLLRYLYENKHTTPFEMAGLVIEVQAPIFVFREWHRHRTQSYNEMSARYVPLPDLNYIPTEQRLLLNSKTNKQAGTVKGAAELTESEAYLFRRRLKDHYDEAEELYQRSLAAGVPKELARIHLPVGRYSRMRASAVLLNWLRFLSLRCAPNAQWEIRQYADAVCRILTDLFPRTMSLFREKETPGGDVEIDATQLRQALEKARQTPNVNHGDLSGG